MGKKCTSIYRNQLQKKKCWIFQDCCMYYVYNAVVNNCIK